MSICYPGTVVERNNKSAREFLFGIFSLTKGLMLAQVREITNLDTTTIQNWVNRGWIKNPIDKRYTENQFAGIIIINMLRDVMKIENISKLMTYLNEDGCEAVSEAQLYYYVCDILDVVDYDIILTPNELRKVIKKFMSDYVEKRQGSREKLENVLELVLIYYATAIVKKEADRQFNRIFNIEDRTEDKEAVYE